MRATLYRWLSRLGWRGGYASGGKITGPAHGKITGPAHGDRYQFGGYVSRGMCSFDGGETWWYTDDGTPVEFAEDRNDD